VIILRQYILLTLTNILSTMLSYFFLMLSHKAGVHINRDYIKWLYVYVVNTTLKEVSLEM